MLTFCRISRNALDFFQLLLKYVNTVSPESPNSCLFSVLLIHTRRCVKNALFLDRLILKRLKDLLLVHFSPRCHFYSADLRCPLWIGDVNFYQALFIHFRSSEIFFQQELFLELLYSKIVYNCLIGLIKIPVVWNLVRRPL